VCRDGVHSIQVVSVTARARVRGAPVVVGCHQHCVSALYRGCKAGYPMSMDRRELRELHYITPISNVPSILALGILSHNRAAGVFHRTVAMSEIQGRRARKAVPGGRRLHDYVNLYVTSRNPMMFKRHLEHEKLCVLRVDTEVLDLPNVVVTDRNAASDYALFKPAPGGLDIIDAALTFAEYWTDANELVQWQKKSAKCAEVLVPDSVGPEYVCGVYVSCPLSLRAMELSCPSVGVSIDRHLFFL